MSHVFAYVQGLTLHMDVLINYSQATSAQCTMPETEFNF